LSDEDMKKKGNYAMKMGNQRKWLGYNLLLWMKDLKWMKD